MTKPPNRWLKSQETSMLRQDTYFVFFFRIGAVFLVILVHQDETDVVVVRALPVDVGRRLLPALDVSQLADDQSASFAARAQQIDSQLIARHRIG